MGLFDDYFNPQAFESGRGIAGWMEALEQQQAAYQPEGGFGGWLQMGTAADPATGTSVAQPPPLPTPPQTSVNQPTPYPVGSMPIPTPRPGDIPSGSISIGDYLMPQYGGTRTPQYTQTQPDLADRLGAGFKSWAYTPVGNPFAALANAITGFNSGQFATAPTPKPQTQPLQQMVQPSEDNAAIPAPIAPTAVQPVVRVLGRRGRLPRC